MKSKLEGVTKTTIFLCSLALFILLNFIVGYIPIRFDFSKGRSHTLSTATRKIIRSLDDTVTIKFFISSDLATRLISLKTDAVDLVNEYKKEGRGKLIVKIRDPKKDSQAADEARESGVPELQFSQVEKDKYAVSNTFFGISIQYGTKKEVIPQATDLSSLEYDITSLIFKMTRKEPIKIGVIGLEEFVEPQKDTHLTIKKILSQQFDLDFINASQSAKTGGLDKNVKTVVVFDDGKTAFGQPEKTMLDSYIKHNGKVIALVDGIWVSEETFTPQSAQHNLFSFFEPYGITLNKDFVLSQLSEIASFSNGENLFVVPYPFWVKTSESLLFPWVSSVDLKKKSDSAFKAVVKSETNAWSQKEEQGISPQTLPPPEKSVFQSFNLIAEAKPKNGGALLVIPSSRFVNEQFIERSPDNVGLFLNYINNYASEGALSGIRARAVSHAPLRAVSDQSKDSLKYATIFLLPGLFGLWGALRLVKRK